MKLFSAFGKKRSPHQDDIDAFHAKHQEMEEIAHRLHKSGHHINIEYENKKHFNMAHSSHGGRGGTTNVNMTLAMPKKITISRSPTRQTGHPED